MIINTKKAFDCFKDIIEFPILGTALYFKMMEYKDLISANINVFTNIQELRNTLKKEQKKWPKSSDYNKFELVKIGEKLWIPVLPGKKDCKPSEIFPGKLVDFIVEKSTPGIIQKHDNLVVPGVKGKVVDIWFEKIQDDYIHGLIKGIDFSSGKFDYKVDVDIEQALNDLKNIDFDEMYAVFRLMFESSDFRKQILREYRKVWKGLHEKLLKQG